MCVRVSMCKLLQDLSVSGAFAILLLITGSVMSAYAKDWSDLAEVSTVFKDKINKVATSLEAASVSVYIYIYIYIYIYTVEPLIKDTPNKGHLFIKDTCFDPMLIPSCII